MDKLIGRERECAMLTKIAQSNRPEFVAIYGRRRVGKTFLVRRNRTIGMAWHSNE